MAVYFDHRIDSPPNAGVATDFAWHGRHTVLAVASQNERPNGDLEGCVNLFLDEGELIEDASLQRAHTVTSLSWHPTRKILACGWSNGELTVWNDHDHQLHEVLSTHHSAVLGLHWHPIGNKLISLDEGGVCAVWKVDQKGRLQSVPLLQCQKPGAMTNCVLRPIRMTGTMTAEELSMAAKRAVAGDEAALDMFVWGAKPKAKSLNQKSKGGLGPISDSLCFFFGGSAGVVYQSDDQGSCVEVLSAGSPIKALLYEEEKELLVTVTVNMMLYQHSVSSDNVATAVTEFKLSGKPPLREAIQVCPGCLATCSSENMIRMWDLARDDNYILDLTGLPDITRSHTVNSIGYSKAKGGVVRLSVCPIRILAAGTSAGHVIMWQFKGASLLGQKRMDGSELWEKLASSKVDGSILMLKWGGNKNLIAINTTTGVQILNENVMNSHYWQQVVGVQVAPGHLSIENFAVGSVQDLKTDIHIKGVFVTKDHVTVWNGKRVVVYELQPLIRVAGMFSCESMTVVVSDTNVYSVEGDVIQVRNFQGIIKQSLSFTEVEGAPLLLDICKSFLAVGTFNGYIKLWDISRREAKQHFTAKCMAELIESFAGLVSVRCNCTGTRISVIANQVDRGKAVPSPQIYIWDADLDTLLSFDFSTASDSSNGTDDDVDNVMTGREELVKDVRDRYPVSHYWDGSDSRLLICETKRLSERDRPSLVASKTDMQAEAAKGGVMVVSLFATPENGVLLHDSIPLDSKYTGLIGVDIPYLYFCKKVAHVDNQPSSVFSLPQDSRNQLAFSETTSSPQAGYHMVARRAMRDFAGLEDSDTAAKTAMMDFSYYLTVGNMDEAFKAIKLIKNESVWENMARMCVKTKRLDVAFVCLGNMGHARGARALREAIKEPEVDARVAMLAVQLGMKEEAEVLYKSCGRHDLLNQFYQAQDKWAESVHVAEDQDRVHLRTTYYNFAQHSEASGDLPTAINAYEKSDTHRTEVPRLLYDDPSDLEGYVMKSKDRALHRWWAQYLESTGDMDSALQFYDAAHDYVSLVRVLCYCGRMDQAVEVANDSGDKGASYHLARHFENMSNVKEAIHYYSKAHCLTNAIKLAKEHHLDHELMNLALQGTKDEMLDAARYYESQQDMDDKAALLYHKGGDVARALTLSFRNKQFSTLQMMAGDLNEQTDPELLDRCAHFFLENEQYDKAVDLLVKAQKHFEALDLCMRHNVQITEDMAERLTLPKPGKEQTSENEYRTRLLERLAECCTVQGSYHLATKKFTQAGNKLKAMKSLLKSQDMEKIIFFTNVSRQKEVYIMAANFLQQQEWRKDPEIMKHIISFYTKGKSLESLAGFYDACAQVEIDDYQNYDKALGALDEALKCMTKAKMKNVAEQEGKVAFLKQRIALLQKFVEARKLYDEQPQEAIKQCQLLLDEPDLEAAVRVGDVYGFMVEHYAREESYRQSYTLMEELRRRVPNVNMAYFVNMRVIEVVHRALDIPLGRGMGAEKSQDDEDSGREEIEDEVEEDLYNGDVDGAGY